MNVLMVVVECVTVNLIVNHSAVGKVRIIFIRYVAVSFNKANWSKALSSPVGYCELRSGFIFLRWRGVSFV